MSGELGGAATRVVHLRGGEGRATSRSPLREGMESGLGVGMTERGRGRQSAGRTYGEGRATRSVARTGKGGRPAGRTYGGGMESGSGVGMVGGVGQ